MNSTTATAANTPNQTEQHTDSTVSSTPVESHTIETETLTHVVTKGPRGGIQVVTSAKPQVKQAWKTLLTKAATDLADLASMVARGYLAIADLLAQARTAYQATQGKRAKKGEPSFTEEAAMELGRSVSWIEKMLRISTLDAETRLAAELTPALLDDVEVLLALVREPDPEKRVEAVNAGTTGGKPALIKQLKGEGEGKPDEGEGEPDDDDEGDDDEGEGGEPPAPDPAPTPKVKAKPRAKWVEVLIEPNKIAGSKIRDQKVSVQVKSVIIPRNVILNAAQYLTGDGADQDEIGLTSWSTLTLALK